MSNKKYYICKMENKVRCRVINRSLFPWKNAKTSDYLFNAKELDEESGMYYYGTRYYAPPVFISRDSLFEKYPFISSYAYCANNSVRYVNPTGMGNGNWIETESFSSNKPKMRESETKTNMGAEN